MRVWCILALCVTLHTDVVAAPGERCITKLPVERSGWWAYRLRNGQKCWYQARPGRQVRSRPSVETVEWDQENRLDRACCAPDPFDPLNPGPLRGYIKEFERWR